ncbi:hypothetical protein GCM10029964_091730 [Kibdelosporangium lantanae]
MLTSLLSLDVVIKQIQEKFGDLPWREVSDSRLPRLHLDMAGVIALTRKIFPTLRNDPVDFEMPGKNSST